MSRKEIIEKWLLENGFKQVYEDEFLKEIKINDDVIKYINFYNYREPEYKIFYMYKNKDLIEENAFFNRFRYINKKKEVEKKLKEMLEIEIYYKEKLKRLIHINELKKYINFKNFIIKLEYERFFFFLKIKKYKKLFKLLKKLDNHLNRMKNKSYKLRNFPLDMVFKSFYNIRNDYILKELIDNDKIFFIFSNYLSDKSYICISYSGSKDDKIYLKDIDLRNYFTLEMLYKTNLIEELKEILNQIQKEMENIYKEYLFIKKL